MIKEIETVAIGWCDNGTVDGKFTEGLIETVLTSPLSGMKITSTIRVEGNQIGRQRNVLFNCWEKDVKTDWLLCIDSDIRMTVPILKKLWDAADSKLFPVVSGTYFIAKDLDGSLMVPFPALFVEHSENTVAYVHPLPENQVITCDYAGMGLVLLHKSIIPILRDKYPDQHLFAEKYLDNNEFISEDIVFFKNLKSVGIQLVAHTGAIPMHIKRFQLNEDYYKLYWNSKG